MFGWAEKLFYGESSADLQAESDELDRKLAEQNQKALERGAITPEVFQQTQDNIAAGRIDAQGEINQAFDEGWDEGKANIRQTVGDVVTSPLGLISWKIWILGGLALLVYMGGWARLRNILKK